jgi:hypothetical protein
VKTAKDCKAARETEREDRVQRLVRRLTDAFQAIMCRYPLKDFVIQMWENPYNMPSYDWEDDCGIVVDALMLFEVRVRQAGHEVPFELKTSWLTARPRLEFKVAK